MDVECYFCRQPVNPKDSGVWIRVTGFRRTGSKAAKVELQEKASDFAHHVCVQDKLTGTDRNQAEFPI